MSISRRHLRIVLVGLALLMSVLLLTGCGGIDPQNTFAPGGDVAQKLRDLYRIVMWPALGILIGVEAALLFVVIRFRRRPDRPLPKQVHGHTKFELAWTIIPLAVLLGIAFPTIDGIFDLSADAPSDALRINVTAHQWWWEFEYPEQGIVTANEMHIPTNRTVALTLTSNDVIHSFWVPRLAGKVDAVPGRENKMWFNATQAGDYSAQCAEFCGIAHALMRFRVIAQEPSEFEAWVRGQQAPAATPTNDAARRGAQFFASSLCIGCHTVSGVSQATVGPNLTYLASRSTIAAGILANNAESLKRWLSNPRDVKPGAKMPVCSESERKEDCTLVLTEQQIDDLVAYLQSLK